MPKSSSSRARVFCQICSARGWSPLLLTIRARVCIASTVSGCCSPCLSFVTARSCSATVIAWGHLEFCSSWSHCCLSWAIGSCSWAMPCQHKKETNRERHQNEADCEMPSAQDRRKEGKHSLGRLGKRRCFVEVSSAMFC